MLWKFKDSEKFRLMSNALSPLSQGMAQSLDLHRQLKTSSLTPKLHTFYDSITMILDVSKLKDVVVVVDIKCCLNKESFVCGKKTKIYIKSPFVGTYHNMSHVQRGLNAHSSYITPNKTSPSY